MKCRWTEEDVEEAWTLGPLGRLAETLDARLKVARTTSAS